VRAKRGVAERGKNQFSGFDAVDYSGCKRGLASGFFRNMRRFSWVAIEQRLAGANATDLKSKPSGFEAFGFLARVYCTKKTRYIGLAAGHSAIGPLGKRGGK
jgi:hypothetical protein